MPTPRSPRGPIDDLRRTWERHGHEDPLWAILAYPDKKGGRWDEDEFLATGQVEVDAFFARAEQLDLTISRGRALDFGCGVGRLSQALATHVAQVDGVDVAAPMIERARVIDRHAPRVTYHLNATDDLALFHDESFDLVYSLIVLQHLPRSLAQRYIGEFARVLRPGGVVHIQLPTEPSRTLRGWLTRVLPAAVLDRVRGWKMRGTPQATVEGWLTDAGLELVDVAPDAWAGEHWISRRYTARKPPPRP